MTASAPTMKRLNLAAILSVIRQAGPLPRTEIAERTGLTKATVTNLVGNLIAEGLVMEELPGRSTGGRRPVPVALNPRSRFVIGVDVGIHEVRVGATDLNAAPIVRQVFPLKRLTSPDQFLAILGDGVDTVLQHMLSVEGMTLDQWLGVGIGMHGIVDAEAGTAIFAPNFGLHNIPIRETLQERFKAPVFVDNDVRAMAAGERWFGSPGAGSDFLFVNVGLGVGAAVVVRGETLTGASGSAGEIGHTVVEPNGRPCACGKKGCLETVASGPSIARRGVEAVRGGIPSLIPEVAGGDLDSVTAYTIYQAASAGDSLARSLFNAAGTHLGNTIGQLVNALDPDAVIIGGGVSGAGIYFWHPLVQRVRQVAVETAGAHLRVMPSTVSDATLIGAATMVLHSLFSPKF
nr:ROK family transcriptional regulator [Sulfobacillus harzensis]